MAFRHFTTDFHNIGYQEFLRPNVGYRYFFDVKKSTTFPYSRTIQLNHVLKPLPSNKASKGELDENETLVDLANIERRYNCLVNLEQVSSIGSDKNILNDGDIVIPKIQPQMGNMFLNSNHNRYVASTELVEFSISKNFNPLFVYYLLTTPQFLADLERLEGGKTHRRVNAVDLLKIKIPDISKSVQDKVIESIKPLEDSINLMRKGIKPHQNIIDKVFTREFHLNNDKFIKESKEKNHLVNLSDFSNNTDLRFSVKFHRDAGKFVLAELKRLTTKKIKHFLSEPICLGVSVSPSNYDENGECFYVSMANIKNWKFESEDAKLVSIDYSNQNQNKTISINDILIARSGEGTIGKVAIIQDEDLRGIFADFTMRIRLKSYNPIFAYYYFRTTYFQYLIEINKKGLGNNTNIFPSQVQELPLIDISLEKQSEIVKDIKKDIDEQERIKDSMESERKKIDEIILKTIK